MILTGKQLFFSSEPIPLPIYNISWPLVGALIEFISLFPIILFSAIALVFVFSIFEEQNHSRFSPQFLSSMAKPLITIIGATAVYGILLLLFQPMLFDSRYRMHTQAQLFTDAKTKATEEIQREDWKEAAIHLAICERIWKQSKETQELRDKLAVAQEKERGKLIDLEHQSPEKGYMETPEGLIPLLSGQRSPVTIREALTLAESNLKRNKAFDAHWYASVAKKMAKPGSPEATEATRLATQAWNAIAEQKPTTQEKNAYRIYKDKLEGYNAIQSGDYIRAYYIFNALSQEVPSDPDVKKYKETALAGTKKVAFFQDEAIKSVGETLSYGLFSIPIHDNQGGNLGLGILKIDTLTILSDVSYGTKVTFQILNTAGVLQQSVQSDYAKFSPFAENKTLMLLKAIDKNNKNLVWEPRWTGTAGKQETYLVLDISYEDFLLASHAQTNSRNLSVLELFNAQKKLASYGFIPQIFQLELLNRIMDPFLCLVLSIVTLALSWRLRPVKKPGFIVFPMVLLLPIAFFLILEGSRIIGTMINTALLLHFSMTFTVIICILNELILLFFAIFFLAGQRS
jgi:lipopolysaccharide export LptBFGC system permease protein LptF